MRCVDAESSLRCSGQASRRRPAKVGVVWDFHCVSTSDELDPIAVVWVEKEGRRRYALGGHMWKSAVIVGKRCSATHGDMAASQPLRHA